MLTTRCGKEAETDYEGFWAKLARENLHWHKPFETVLDETDAPFYKWFEDGLMNVSYNCLDVNLQKGNGDKVAVIFEADGGEVTGRYLQRTASQSLPVCEWLEISRYH
jgi:acetyl-CoA synthetase